MLQCANTVSYNDARGSSNHNGFGPFGDVASEMPVERSLAVMSVSSMSVPVMGVI